MSRAQKLLIGWLTPRWLPESSKFQYLQNMTEISQIRSFWKHKKFIFFYFHIFLKKLKFVNYFLKNGWINNNKHQWRFIIIPLWNVPLQLMSILGNNILDNKHVMCCLNSLNDEILVACTGVLATCLPLTTIERLEKTCKDINNAITWTMPFNDTALNIINILTFNFSIYRNFFYSNTLSFNKGNVIFRQKKMLIFDSKQQKILQLKVIYMIPFCTVKSIYLMRQNFYKYHTTKYLFFYKQIYSSFEKEKMHL